MYSISFLAVVMSCTNSSENIDSTKAIRLITVDPGHFQEALVLKSMYDNVDSVVHVYAPVGADVELHMKRIEEFNTRAENPGIELKKLKDGCEVIVPHLYKEGHQAHFGRAMAKFLEYLNNHNIPDWEVPNMLAKYFTNTKALELVKQK